MIKLFMMRYKLYNMYKSWNKTKNFTMLKQIKKLEKEIEHKERVYLFNQTCFIYCPRCENELIFESHVKTTKFLEYYKCCKCGEESAWNFDIAPAPIRVKYPDNHEYNERVKLGEIKPEDELTEKELKILSSIAKQIYFKHDDKHGFELDMDEVDAEIVNSLNYKLKEMGKGDIVEAVKLQRGTIWSNVGLKLKYRSVEYENKR